MNNKEVLGRIGFAIIGFILLVLIVDAQDSGAWATLQTVKPNLANERSLGLLWTTLATSTIIQGFMLYAALLGSNLQFSPPTKEREKEEES
ncbi:MAG: hypothetical protein ACFFB5_14795 [Promethearchaeota archaeon]